MKRKVASGLLGNFRGVCPILNRANKECRHSRAAGKLIPPRVTAGVRMHQAYVTEQYTAENCLFPEARAR